MPTTTFPEVRVPFNTLFFLSAAKSHFFSRSVYSRISAQHGWIRGQVCAGSANPPDWYDCSQIDGPPAKQPTRQPTRPPVTPTPTTPAPTRSPLPAGRRRIFVVIQLDSRPEETGWTLATLEDGQVVYEVPIGSYASGDAGKLVQYEAVVDTERFYNLTIRDLLGDGFAGTMDVFMNDDASDLTALVREPGFTSVSGTAVSHGFYVGASPAQFLTLQYAFDDFAHEVAYEIKCDGDGVIFALAWFGTFLYAMEETLVIPIYGPERGDQSYTVKLWDEGNDGICCSWGEGSYKLFVGDPEEGNLLRSGGNYGASETFQFVIEGDPPPTPSPTRNPSRAPTSPPTPPPTLPPTQEPSMPPTPPPSSSPTTGALTKTPTLAPLENDAPATYAPSGAPVDVGEIETILAAANDKDASGAGPSVRAHPPWRSSAFRAATVVCLAGALLF